MPNRPTISDELDEGWEVDDPEPPEVVLAATGALRAPPLPNVRLGFGAPVTLPPERSHHLAPSDVPAPLDDEAFDSAPPRQDVVTVPPPVPQDEYVAQMMAEAEPARAPRRTIGYREPMATLHEEEPLRFDLPDDRVTPVGPAAPAGDAGPAIELAEELVDIDPELLRDTPVPPRDDALEHAIDATRAFALTHEPSPRAPAIRAMQDEGTALTLGDLDADDDLDPGRVTLPGHEPSSREGAIQDRFVLGDYSGALVLAEALLEEEPANAAAKEYAVSCRELLREMYETRLGDRTYPVRLALPPDQIRGLSLDHRGGFLLSCIDGMNSIEEILDVCGMPPLEALRTLYDLVQQGVVVIEPPAPTTPRRR